MDSFGRGHKLLAHFADQWLAMCVFCNCQKNMELLTSSWLQTELIAIAKVFVEAGVRKIRLTGGEPLLRRDAELIFRGLAQLGVELAITTNGLLLHEFLDVFAEIGLTKLNISLDTLDSARFAAITRRDQYAIVKPRHRLGLAAQVSCEDVNMVVMRGVDDDELVDFVLLGKNSDLHLRFIEFMPFDGNSWNWENVFSYMEMPWRRLVRATCSHRKAGGQANQYLQKRTASRVQRDIFRDQHRDTALLRRLQSLEAHSRRQAPQLPVFAR